MAKKINIMVAAGGTGGHLFPTLAVVEQLEILSKGNIDFFFIGNPDKIEARVVPEKGYYFFPIIISGLTKKISLDTLALPFKILKAKNICKKIILDNKIDLLLAAGAYLSYPPALAAAAVNVPIFLIESNVNPGKTIKLLSKKAKLVFTSFDETKKYFSNKLHSKLKPNGNPVRLAMSQDIKRSDALSIFNLDTDKKTVLVFGGSLGARSINSVIEQSLDKIAAQPWQLLWQTGKNYTPPSVLPSNIHIFQFIDDMASAYAASDLVVSRSGGTTVAELGVVGKPSILIPLPSASNDEQRINALTLVKYEAAKIIDDKDISEHLLGKIISLIADDVLLGKMSAAALSTGKPNAAFNCASDILSTLNINNIEV
ncbi:MAG: undecaprenyldiphospho-muramoylpentapeptide beta-N-acetylglucosaminyltransferase [Candidatus Kapabacteria bacterium]|nr:undecaprenyldiphospho-muramoylpentapeptide beta-N-acetylglucosaminyltransferase [Candidatus Kapabacteria bacterium]